MPKSEKPNWKDFLGLDVPNKEKELKSASGREEGRRK
jgi:hypothetical protein